MGGLHIDDKIVGLSISKWLPCPLAIWNFLFGMAILLSLVKIHTAAFQHADFLTQMSFVFFIQQRAMTLASTASYTRK